ncbi:MAG: glycosyltransferase family 4 protein [Saprospiraceae bacterium]
MEKRTKVCVVGPSLKMGGMERASANLANSIYKVGYEVTYLSFFNQEKFFQLDDGVKLIEPIGFNSTSLSIFCTLKWIRKNIKELNPDSIIVFNKFYSALVLVALFGLKSKVFISERSSPLFKWNFKHETINRLIFWFFKPTGIIAQTSIAAQYQKEYYGKNIPIEVIPNALRPVLHFPNIQKEKIILAVGRLRDPLKGFDRLIEAFAKIKAKDWKLVFAGGDENGFDLKKQAKELRVLDRIGFLGQVRDLDPIYAKASIFVIPSRSEGFPNALCEAMAAGLPCIAFDFIAGPRDIITHEEDGIIVEDGNISKLAEAIDSLIENKEKRSILGENAEAIQERLSQNVIGKKMLSFVLS